MADPHAQHGHDHAEDDDHPGYSLPSNIAAIVAIPTMIFGLGFTMGLWGPPRDLLLFVVILSACVVALGAIGILWAAMAERRFATGIFAIVLGVVTLVGTGWAYDETGDPCPEGQTRDGLVCTGGGAPAGGAEEGGGGQEGGGGGSEGGGAGTEPSATQPEGGGAESGAPGGEG